MFKTFVNILLLLSFTSVVVGQKFCKNIEPVDSIFTLDWITYARKQALFYRTLVGQPFGNAEEKYFEYLFHRTSDAMKFTKIETGFMVTKIPGCGSNVKQCEPVQKLKGMAFVLGVPKPSNSSSLIHQAYKTYRFVSIIGLLPNLEPVTDMGEMPFKMPYEAEVKGELWPLKASGTVRYLHTTYDESSYSIVYLVYDGRETKVYTLNLKDIQTNIVFETHDSLPNSFRIIKGFFHLMTTPSNEPYNRTDPTNIHAIGQLVGSDDDITFDFGRNFVLSNASSVSLDDIYGCVAPTTTEMTTFATIRPQETTPKTSSSETEVNILPTGTTEYNTPKDINTELQTSTTTPLPTATEEPSSLWLVFWVLMVLGVLGLILLIAMIAAVLYIRHRNANKNKDQNNPKVVESATKTSGSGVNAPESATRTSESGVNAPESTTKASESSSSQSDPATITRGSSKTPRSP